MTGNFTADRIIGVQKIRCCLGAKALELADQFDCGKASDDEWLNLAARYHKLDALMLASRRMAELSTATICFRLVDNPSCGVSVSFGDLSFDVYYSQGPQNAAYSFAWSFNAAIPQQYKNYAYATVLDASGYEQCVDVIIHPYYNESPDLWQIDIENFGVCDPDGALAYAKKTFNHPTSPLTPDGRCLSEADAYGLFSSLWEYCCDCGPESFTPGNYYSVVYEPDECCCDCGDPPPEDINPQPQR